MNSIYVGNFKSPTFSKQTKLTSLNSLSFLLKDGSFITKMFLNYSYSRIDGCTVGNFIHHYCQDQFHFVSCCWFKLSCGKEEEDQLLEKSVIRVCYSLFKFLFHCSNFKISLSTSRPNGLRDNYLANFFINFFKLNNFVIPSHTTIIYI